MKLEFFNIFIFLILSVSFIECGHNKEEWKTRAIYQLMTDRFATSDGSEPECILNQYCGGTHIGLRKKLDYIQGMGFDAIWISPIVKNTEGSYHSYHTIDFYGINEHFGTEQDLIDLITECHNRDIWVMLDVVANHVGPVGLDFSTIVPFNSPEHYHDSCVITDWTNQKMVENCRLCDLPDLKQENDFVADTLIQWIKDIIEKYDIDGIRVDTVPEVPKWFWSKFSKSAGVYSIGEVFNGDPHYVAGYQGCLDATFNYPLSFTIKDAFCGDMRKLQDYWENSRNIYPDPKILGVFIDNHDNNRFLHNCKSKKSLENAVVFSIFFEGIPVHYYGDEQYFDGGEDPNNREPLWGHYDTENTLYNEIKKSNKVRKSEEIWNTELIPLDSDESFYSFSRGEILICVTKGVEAERDVTNYIYSEGQKICNIFKDDDCITVFGDKIHVKMEGDPKIYMIKDKKEKLFE